MFARGFILLEIIYEKTRKCLSISFVLLTIQSISRDAENILKLREKTKNGNPGSDQALRQHRFGHLFEARDVRARDQIVAQAVFLGRRG